MSSRTSKTKGTDQLRNGRDAIRALKRSMQGLVQAGDVKAVKRLAEESAKELGLPSDLFHALEIEAEEALADTRARFPQELKRAAEAAECAFLFKPPFAQIGCVHLSEKKLGEWTLSVLDDVPIRTLETNDWEPLLEVSLELIQGITATLDRFAENSKYLSQALKALQRMLGQSEDLPVNLVMLLTAQGRALRKRLTSPAEASETAPLSRAEFGFLLSAVARRGRYDQSLPQLSLGGAPQAQTSQPDHFISIPDSEDPREHAARRLIATVSVKEVP